MKRSIWSFGVLCITLGALNLALQKASFPSQPGEDTWVNRPNDPRYLRDWQLYSHLPLDYRGEIDAYEKNWGSGLHVDKAWQLHTGSPETIIAILDSGIYWNNKDLVDRAWLNRAELPLPEGSEVYDANQDGRFSVSDYQGDSRVSDKNGNDMLDPGDLIAIFSNGRDEDGNGYIDDISGWDFHELDNNPADRTQFGHGTSQAKDSVAALNNGIGSAGICGNCSFMPLRLDDSFIVDANAYAQAVKYATDQNVALVQQALGSLNWTPQTKEAINYAYDKGMIIIGSAADENSFHHNYPATLDPILYANNIRADTANFREATTFLNFNNCSNFGARVDVTVSGESCSSEATANLAGITGLAISYARSLGITLSPGELTALIKQTADDINRGPVANDARRHSSFKGWDLISGYGRVNAHSLLLRLRDKRIPPEARVTSPNWFAVLRESTQSKIPVDIQVSARTSQVEVTLWAARGAETAGAEFKKLCEKSFATAYKGELCQVPVASLAGLQASAHEPARNKNAITFKLEVIDANGETSEARRTFFIMEDQTLHTQYPRLLAGSGESSGFFADLNQDGKQEFITADGGGFIHAFTSTGSAELKGFPVATAASSYQVSAKESSGAIVAPLAGADINKDGNTDIVAASLEGVITAIQHDGQTLPGFPIRLPALDWNEVSKRQVLDYGVLASPVLADLDADGWLEIIVAALDGRLHVYRHDGAVQPGFPIKITHQGRAAKLVSSPAVADIDQDGVLDLVLGTNHAREDAGYVFAVNGKGSQAAQLMLPGFPKRIAMLRDHTLPTVGWGIPAAPVIGDIDADGEAEIVVHPFVGKVYILSIRGEVEKSLNMRMGAQSNSQDTHMIPAFAQPALSDLNGDNIPEVVTGGAGRRALTNLILRGIRFDYDHLLGAWDGATGQMLPAFPQVMDDMQIYNSPIAADLDPQSAGQEVLMASGGYFLRAFGQNGEVSELTKFTGGWVFSTPSLGDFDGDGFTDIAATTREGYVFIWRTSAPYSQESVAWSTFKGSPARLGVWQ